MRITNKLWQLLFPSKCLLCRKILEPEELDLCHSCRENAPLCTNLQKKFPFIDSWVAVWYYEDNARSSLLRYKFRGARSYAQGYGRLLSLKLQQQEQSYDLLTWVPISPRRKLSRGYDQVELLAQSVGQELGMEPVRLLRKIRHNPPQSGIAGEAQRRANVLGAYCVTDAVILTGKRILLLDDVITTGSTAGECARMLLTAGAKEVHCGAMAVVRHQANKKVR